MTKRQILEELKRDELIAAVDRYELPVADRRVRDLLVDALASSRRAKLAEILGELKRARLKELCRALGLDDSGKAKAVIVERLTGKPPAAAPAQTTLDFSEASSPPTPSKPSSPARPSKKKTRGEECGSMGMRSVDFSGPNPRSEVIPA